MNDVARLAIGGNNPPPLEMMAIHIEDLFALVSGSTAAPVTTDEQEAALDTLLDDVRTAAKDAGELKEAEYRPHKAAGDKVVADWKPLLARCDAAADAIKAALTPYRQAIQRAKDAAAAKAREEAAALQRAAQDALRKSDDLDERFEAEQRLKAATKLAEQANRIDRTATGLRTYWEAELTNPFEALQHYTATRTADVIDFVQGLADGDARGARAPVPGVTFIERKRAR